MSMLSAQCDKLRKAALEARAMGRPETFVLMRDAADTILSLRDKAQDLQSENAKLREQVTQLQCDWESERDYANQMEAKEKRAVSENAKLRELAHLVAEYTSADQCEGCVTKCACNAGELDICWIRKAILEKLCEIGIEVVR